MNYYEILQKALSDADDWEFVGGNTQTSHINRWCLKFPNREMPGEEDECECSHPIKENCYIYSKKLDEIKIIGNCCVKRFLPDKDSRKLKCENCGLPHNNRKVNKCNDCRPLFCENHNVKNCNICAWKIRESDYNGSLHYYKWIDGLYIYFSFTKYGKIYIKIPKLNTIWTEYKVIDSETINSIEKIIDENLESEDS
jgi:hypothetical protein